MSQELVGNCGAIVGSDEYFQRINHGAIFAPFLGGYQYSSAIGQLCSRCVSVMEEIYSDMRNAPTTVFALQEEQKENLRKTIANLDEAASFLFPSYTCAMACRAMLEIDKPESDSGIGSIWDRDIGSNSYIQSKCSPIY